MSQPIDDLEKQVQAETVRHDAATTKANDILSRFMEGNARVKTAVDSYQKADKAIKGKLKHA